MLAAFRKLTRLRRDEMLGQQSTAPSPQRRRRRTAAPVLPLPTVGYARLPTVLSAPGWRKSKHFKLIAEQRFPPPTKIDGMDFWTVGPIWRLLGDLTLVNRVLVVVGRARPAAEHGRRHRAAAGGGGGQTAPR